MLIAVLADLQFAHDKQRRDRAERQPQPISFAAVRRQRRLRQL